MLSFSYLLSGYLDVCMGFSNKVRFDQFLFLYNQKIFHLHYDDVPEDFFTAATRHNTSCSEDKTSFEWRSNGSSEHIKETKIADSV